MTQRPLASYLTRLILLSILPLVVLTAWWAVDSVKERSEATRKEARQLAHNAASLIDQYLDARIRALSMLSASPLADDLAGWRRLYAEAQGFERSFGSHVIFSDVGDPMQMRFNTRVPFDTELPPLPVPSGTAAAPLARDTGWPAIGDSFMGPVAHEPLVAIVVPGLRDGDVRHLMLTTLAARQLQEPLDGLALPDGWSLAVHDSRGERLAVRDAGAGRKGSVSLPL